MSDKELFDWAEFMFGKGDNAQDKDIACDYYQQSMAASLLVIARSSIASKTTTGIDLALGKDKTVVTPSEEMFVKTRLAEYEPYWNAGTGLYEIEHDWCPTKTELEEDLKKSYKFEVLDQLEK